MHNSELHAEPHIYLGPEGILPIQVWKHLTGKGKNRFARLQQIVKSSKIESKIFKFLHMMSLSNEKFSFAIAQ